MRTQLSCTWIVIFHAPVKFGLGPISFCLKPSNLFPVLLSLHYVLKHQINVILSNLLSHIIRDFTIRVLLLKLFIQIFTYKQITNPFNPAIQKVNVSASGAKRVTGPSRKSVWAYRGCYSIPVSDSTFSRQWIKNMEWNGSWYMF